MHFILAFQTVYVGVKLPPSFFFEAHWCGKAVSLPLQIFIRIWRMFQNRMAKHMSSVQNSGYLGVKTTNNPISLRYRKMKTTK